MTHLFFGLSRQAAFQFRAFAGALFLFSPLPGLAADAADIKVTQYTLENGLTVILAPTPSQSVASVMQYDVGSANEAPGRSGFAHLFEHLMFEGTKSVPDFDKIVSAAGSDNNAFTQEDQTVYYMSGPKEALPVFLRLDADRMANLANAVSQEDLDNQRAVVLNEMRQNVLDQPGGAAREETMSALFPAGHPYAHATIGSIADLGAAKLQDVQAFHRAFYVPSNAVLAVTGSFDLEKTRALIERTFSPVPKSEKPKPAEASAAEAKPKRLNFTDAVAAPLVYMQWPGTGGFSQASVVNDMLADALTVGKGALDNRLIVQQGIASWVSARWEQRRLGGIFTVAASAAPGVSAEKLEAALTKTLAEMRMEPISEDTLKIVRTDIETEYSSVPSSPVSFAILLAKGAMDPSSGGWRGAADLSKTVTAAEVSAAFRSFSNETAQISIVAPGPRNSSYPPAIANSTGSSISAPFAARAEIAIPETAMAEAAAVVFPQTETRRLASGAALIAYRIEDPAKAAISLVVKGGDLDAPAELSDLAMDVSSRGAGALSLADLDVRFRESGISLYGGSGRHFSRIMASAPLQKFDALCAQLADVVMHPRFDLKEWEAALGQSVSGLQRAEKSPDYQAARMLRKTLYPNGALEARETDIAALKVFESKDAKALFLARMRPDQAEFHVASSLPADEVAKALDAAFAGWTADNSAPVLQSGTLPVVRKTNAESQIQGATQAAILAAIAAPGKGTPDAVAFDLAVQVLGGSADSRLNKVLREEKGWAYGISAGANGEKGRNNSLLVISTSVQADHTQGSIAEIRRIISGLAAQPITEAEFQSARRSVKAQYLNAFESAEAMAGFAGSFSASGYALEDFKKLLADIDAATLEETNRQAAIIANSPMALSVAGDKALMK